MKKSVLSVFIFIALFTTKFSQAQDGCLNIIQSSFRINNSPDLSCQKNFSLDFINPSNGNRRINIVVSVGTTKLLTTCVNASGHKDELRSFTTANFTACSLSGLVVAITPITGVNCENEGCLPTIYFHPGITLPVVFNSFSALRTNDVVLLKWETGTEMNNTGFAIERNMNGTWQQVGFTATKAINGNSESKLNYEYSDININKGMTQYRLKQIDADGKSKYSDIKAIRGTEQDAKTVLYPNPSADGKVNVVFADAAARDIAVMDMTGRIVKQWSSFSSNSLQVTGLNTGMFSIRIFNRETGVQSTEKLMVTAK